VGMDADSIVEGSHGGRRAGETGPPPYRRERMAA